MSDKNPNEVTVVVPDEDEEEDEITEEAIPTAYLKAIAQDEFATPWDMITYDMGIPTKKASSIIELYVKHLLAGQSPHFQGE